MEPHEIVENLKQAAVAVQTNLSVFENSCVTAGNQVLVTQGAFSEKTQQLTEELRGMSSEKDQFVAYLGESIISNVEDADSQICSASDALSANLVAKIEGQLASLSEEFEGVYVSGSNLIEQTVAELESVQSSYETLSNNFESSVNNAITGLSDARNSVTERLEQSIEFITDTVQQAHEQLLQEYQGAVNSAIGEDLAGKFSLHDSDLQEFGDQLLQNLEDVGEEVSDSFDELAEELVDHLSEKATQEMKEKLNGIIEKIVGELTSTLTESTIKSQIGVSVTGTISPMIPFLIAFNKVFSIIEGAISAFKAMKAGF